MSRQRSATTPQRIGVAIAVHSWQVLAECLEKLEASETEAELFITRRDDGSTDGTRAALECASQVEVVSGDGSLWWTGGPTALLGSPSAGCDLVLLLNPDAFVEALDSKASGRLST